MKKICTALLCALLIVNLPVPALSAGAAQLTGSLHGVDTDGLLIDGVLPGMTREEVEALGMVFDEGLILQKSSDGLRSSEIWPGETPITLDGVQMQGSAFQFVNGRLVNIQLNVPDLESAQRFCDQLQQMLGTPQTQEYPAGNNAQTIIYDWDVELIDMLLRLSMIFRVRDGVIVSANLQVSYLFHDLYAAVLKRSSGSLTALPTTGVLINGVLPGMSKEEVEAAGIAFQADMVRQQTRETLHSETWTAETTVVLEYIRMQAAAFQFVNGRLENIQLNLPDEESTRFFLERLKEEMGEASINEYPTGQSSTATIYQWDVELSDMLLRVGMLLHQKDGQYVRANLQASYLFYDLYADLLNQ